VVQNVLALPVGHLQGARNFVPCAAYASAYMVGILHIIKIVIMKIHYCDS